ncbi:putative uncharacterized protein AFDN-DT [Sapajus apella]|uniref:Uncharacterized protein n=1 Tax=Sapajus apella TaxID=9515 RepID=A0A6J3GYJ0_SAPAP|nr:putative uncharacterized protein AFDN-DT [Sapajus apella]
MVPAAPPQPRGAGAGGPAEDDRVLSRRAVLGSARTRAAGSKWAVPGPMGDRWAWRPRYWAQGGWPGAPAPPARPRLAPGLLRVFPPVGLLSAGVASKPTFSSCFLRWTKRY